MLVVKNYLLMLGAAVSLAGCKAVTLGEIHEFKDQLLSSQGPITRDEINIAFKQTLEQGAKKGVERLSQKGAFLNDPELKIPFPPEAQKLENKLRRLGLNSICDRFQESVNLAAESAMQTALPIFTKAIEELSFSDVVRLLKGGDHAITDFLRSKTEPQLIAQFKPVISQRLEMVSATKHWAQVVSAYNKLSSSGDLSADLSQFVTEQTIDGLFSQIAQEEGLVRKDPVARTTYIMQKVFGQSE